MDRREIYQRHLKKVANMLRTPCLFKAIKIIALLLWNTFILLSDNLIFVLYTLIIIATYIDYTIKHPTTYRKWSYLLIIIQFILISYLSFIFDYQDSIIRLTVRFAILTTLFNSIHLSYEYTGEPSNFIIKLHKKYIK